MVQDIYDPLKEYADVYHDRFKEVAETTFAELAREAQVDVEANRETCRKLYATRSRLASAQSRKSNWTMACAVLWVAVAGGAVYAYLNYQVLQPEVLGGIAIGAVLIVLFLLFKVHPRLKELDTECDKLQEEARQLEEEAWKQMEPLNCLYDWDVLTRMMTKTVPRLEFDPYFTTQRLADLKRVYGWDDTFNEHRSVVYSHSGLINGNPFVICRTRKMEMGTKTYQGQKVIHWTTTERGSDGKYHTVTHSQTLIATVTAPYPEYFEKTRLIYGNTAAPDLMFYRKKSGLAGKEGSLSFRWNKRSLRKKARDLEDSDFAMMTNEDFEVAFDTSNRNNNQQFALLFTPLAQETMLNLLRDKKVGYGDDFDFGKNQMINMIIADHMQDLDLDMNPNQYRHFDYDQAQKDFYSINARYFHAIYFNMAPLLCVPMYQQIRPQHDIYGRDMEMHSAFWEHEALANFWGYDRFKHPDCVTNCILKTEERRGNNGNSTIVVHAYGYRTVQRVTYVNKWGGDGRSHSVPVYWDEYLPVTGNGQISMREDNDDKPSSDMSQKERLGRIYGILNQAGLSVYRRHIASKC